MERSVKYFTGGLNQFHGAILQKLPTKNIFVESTVPVTGVSKTSGHTELWSKHGCRI